ncbi:50S ribosomal protein L30e-like protein [Talaromyces proteolyticus]|uniref:50S ribosomal protein L30e-like protein n=1 Tax=Talaromyces proteolyticus TaxID=1131652 RepID=A0AAD4KUB3_9EURO|nr:50S ribosomal protein L30e-like protein [Talaromyces proteolyticus]KAH8698559.1 50S ribosomal protein L30e-like protein [Talaromyces proteolyticus]
MGKDKSEKKDKKEKKEKKRSETDGVQKQKKEKKKEKKLSEVAEKEILEELQKPETVEVNGAVEVTELADKPIGALVPFANPLVEEEKTAKKVFKTVKKSAVNKSLKRGVKEVVKALRKSPIPAANVAVTEPIGVVILAADISPPDVISHIPVLCEEHGVPYLFVKSRAELGAAGATKRPTSVVMVTPKSAGKNKKKDGEAGDDEDFGKTFADIVKLAQKEQEKVKI